MLLSNPPSLHPRRPLMACASHGGTRIHPRHHLPGITGLLLLLYGVLCRAPEHPSSTTTSPATPGYDAVPIGDATRTGRGAGCGLGGWRCSLGHVHYSDMYSSNFRFSAASSLALLVHTSVIWKLSIFGNFAKFISRNFDLQAEPKPEIPRNFAEFFFR